MKRADMTLITLGVLAMAAFAVTTITARRIEGTLI